MGRSSMAVSALVLSLAMLVLPAGFPNGGHWPLPSAALAADPTCTPNGIMQISLHHPNQNEGQTFTFDQAHSLATIFDGHGENPLSNYTVTVYWGDGTSNTSGDGNVGLFKDSSHNTEITASHAYPEEDSGPTREVADYYRTVFVTDSDGDSGCNSTHLFSVSDSPLHAVGTTQSSPALAVAGRHMPVLVGTFTDDDPGGKLSDYTARVLFGNGSFACTGEISPAQTGYAVFVNPSTDCSAAHQNLFDTPGLIQCGVEADDIGGSSNSDNCWVNVLGIVPHLSGQGPPNPCPPCQSKDAGDPVTLSSGHLTEVVTDLRILGRGFDYTFERSYQSGAGIIGPLGYNWDFNYNRRLIAIVSSNLADVQVQFPNAKVGDVERVDGAASRADLYVANNDGSFTAPAGFFTTLTKNSDGSFVEHSRSGFVWSYAAADSATGMAPMMSMSDRHGNTMTFQYDSQGRLSTVVDTLGRTITYTYNAGGLLDHITDFTGRTVSFGYTDSYYLTSVTGPAVTGTPNDNDFPNGRTTRYTYDETSGLLNGNLLTIESPNQVAAGAPSASARVQITYQTDSSSPDFGKVIGQTDGGTVNGLPAGGTIQYAYQSLAGDPTNPNSAISQTTVTDRNGNQTVYQFDALGSVLLRRQLTNRGVDPTPPGPFDTTYTYNADDQVLIETDPLGNSTQYTYDSNNPDRFQQGNRLSITHIPDAHRGGDQTKLTTTYTYEPIFNQLRTVTDPRGNDASYVPQNGGTASAARYTTTNTFDYEEGCNFAALGAKIGVTAASAQQLLTAAGMCASSLGDVNGDGITSRADGNIIRVAHGGVHLGAACPAATLTQATITCSLQARLEGTSTQPIVDLKVFNQYGQRTSTVDPEGNVTTYSYYPATDPNGDGTVENPNGDSATGGYLKQRTIDASLSAVRDSHTNPTPAAIPTLYRYDEAGNVTQVVNGRGIATTYTYNQLNELVQITRAASHNNLTPNPAEPYPLTDYQYLQRRFYDYDGNLVLSQVEDRSNTSGAAGPPASADLPATAQNPNPANGPSFVDTVYKYDVLDEPTQTVNTVSNGANPLFLYTSYRYDPNGNRVLTIEPAGNASSAIFDERDLPYQTTAGATSPPALALLAPSDATSYDVRGGAPQTSTLHHDANGNLIAVVDGNGHATRSLYDGFDRTTSVVDAVGNQSVTQYDPAGDIVRVTRFGLVGGPSPAGAPQTLAQPVSSGGVIQVHNLVSATLLAATAYRYDEEFRRFQVDRSLFVNTGLVMRKANVKAGATDLGKLNLDPTDTCAVPGLTAPLGGWLGCVSSRSEYDRNGRATFTINDQGEVTASSYDGANRLIRTADPSGNTVETVYDDNGNVIENRRTDLSQIKAVAPEIFLDTTFYDSLDRRVGLMRE